MNFTSPTYAPFLLGVLFLAATFSRQHRWIVLLGASVASYATFGPPYLMVAWAAVTLGTYGLALAMVKTPDPVRKRKLLRVGIALVLGILGVLKYSGFLGESIDQLGSLVGWHRSSPSGGFLVSIGVSYYALQAIGYLVDVHDEAAPVEPHFGRFALFLSFFPKMVQGPIERSESLLPQFREQRPIMAQDLASGFQRILWGLFQKVVIADSLAPFVEAVYGNIRAHDGVSIVLATYFFAAQLYFDFAGYTDMAIGSATMLGIRFSPNFRSPYLASSIADFWRRWHITFSTWLLDYVFRPLQIHLRDWRVWGTPVALFITFIVSGIWHGATWGFVVWGAIHGAYLATAVLLRPWQARLHRSLHLARSPILKPIQVLITFHLVCLSWVFFRAPSVGDAGWAVLQGVAGMPRTLAHLAQGESLDSLLYLGQGRRRFMFVLAMIALGSALRYYFRHVGVTEGEGRAGNRKRLLVSPWTRAVVYGLMVYLIAFFGTATQGFMYEQF